MYNLLASAINHPDQVNTLWGVFNHRSLISLSNDGVAVTALVPRPHAPPVGPFSEFGSIPDQDSSFPYRVVHPRFWYFLPKSLFYHRSGDSMATTVERWIASSGELADVHHGCHLYPDAYALSTLKSPETPLTAYAHGTIVNEFGEFNRKTQLRIREAIRQAAHVFCSGYDVADTVQQIEPDSTTSVVPIGATPAHFPTERRSLLRQELNVPDDKRVVLYCGHYSAAKGVNDLVSALEGFDDDSIYFVGIGHGGDLRSDLQQVLAGEGPPHGRALWKLHPVAVRRWFAVADLFVLPSYSEGRPTVIYEAMASQTPVLATTVGGVPEQVEDGTTGWLFEPGDVSAIEEHVTDHTQATVQRMGKAAQSRLEQQGWTWDAHADRIRTVHRDLLNQ
jgi:glycosyltransferase involved in cell wall biosynthesis